MDKIFFFKIKKKRFRPIRPPTTQEFTYRNFSKYCPDNPYWEINNSLIVCDTDCQFWKKADLYKNILATLHLHGEVTWGSDAFDIYRYYIIMSAHFWILKNVKHLVLSRCVQTQEQQVIISLTPPCCYHQFFQEHIIRLLQNILCYAVLNKHTFCSSLQWPLELNVITVCGDGAAWAHVGGAQAECGCCWHIISHMAVQCLASQNQFTRRGELKSIFS